MGVSQLGKELTPQETGAIAAFLGTLTGEQPRVELPLLPSRTAGPPRPSPLVKNSVERDGAVEGQNAVR
jgi:cytochrome c peroxidase